MTGEADDSAEVSATDAADVDAATPARVERDAFHVWDGILSARQPQPTEGGGGDGSASSKKIPIRWEGTVVSYPDSPDATRVEVPRRGAFDGFVASEVRFVEDGEAVKVEARERRGEGGGGGEEEGAADADADAPSAVGTFYKIALGGSPDEAKNEKGAKDEEGGAMTAAATTTTKTTTSSKTTHELFLRTLRWTGNLDDQTVNLVFSRGSSPSRGPFVAAGWMRVGNRLTIGRRYVDMDDPRAGWTVEELWHAVVNEICANEDGRPTIPPWKCRTMRASSRWENVEEEGRALSKRRKVQVDGADGR